MVYCETIEESKIWVCPKTGVWKIICIGGGGAGESYYRDDLYMTGASGGTTSFGNYLSAKGGISGKNITSDAHKAYVAPAYGINGFNGAAEYGSPSGAQIGTGYGASGGAIDGGNLISSAGLPGEVKTLITDISTNQSVACTVGIGGVTTAFGNISSVRIYAWPGSAGAIIVQYLGSEM